MGKAPRCGAYLLTALASCRSRRSCSPSGCTFPWGTAGHLGESVAKTGEFRQPLLRNRLRERAAIRGLAGAAAPTLSGKGLGMDPPGSCSLSVPAVLSRATLMGEGQAVLWGRAVGPGDAGGRLLVPA